MGNSHTSQILHMAADYITKTSNMPTNYLDYRNHPASLLKSVELNISPAQFQLFLVNGLHAYDQVLRVPLESQTLRYSKLKTSILADLLLGNMTIVPKNDEEAYNRLVDRIGEYAPGVSVDANSENRAIFTPAAQIILHCIDNALDELNSEVGRILIEQSSQPKPFREPDVGLNCSYTVANPLLQVHVVSPDTKEQQLNVAPTPYDDKCQYCAPIGGEVDCSTSDHDCALDKSNKQSKSEILKAQNEVLLNSWRQSLSSKLRISSVPEKASANCTSCNASFKQREVGYCRSCSKAFCNMCCPVREYLYPDGHSIHNRYCYNCEGMFLMGSGAEVLVKSDE